MMCLCSIQSRLASRCCSRAQSESRELQTACRNYDFNAVHACGASFARVGLIRPLQLSNMFNLCEKTYGELEEVPSHDLKSYTAAQDRSLKVRCSINQSYRVHLHLNWRSDRESMVCLCNPLRYSKGALAQALPRVDYSCPDHLSNDRISHSAQTMQQ